MKVILLHSVPRSGSTWLQTLLDSYPNIKTIYQPLFSYAFKNRVSESSTDQELDQFCNDLLATTDPFCLRESDLHTDSGVIDIPQFDKDTIDILIIKNVHHHYIIERFLQRGHKLLALIRDPRAVVYSQLSTVRESDPDWLYAKTKNGGKRENYFGYQSWREIIYLFDMLKRKYPQQVHIIRYEDLVTNFDQCSLGITSFLSLDDQEPLCKAQKQLSSTTNNYDYSVYKQSVDLQKWRKLPAEIIEYINKDLFNDIILRKYYTECS